MGDLDRGDADTTRRISGGVPGGGTDSLTPATGRLEIGGKVGRYVVVANVGSGGMGQVVRAYDAKLHRKQDIDKALEAFEHRQDRKRSNETFVALFMKLYPKQPD